MNDHPVDEPAAAAGHSEALDPAAPPQSHIPTTLRVTAEICWRLLIIAAAVALLLFLVAELRIVIIPVAIAVLLSALLSPAVYWLVARRVPRGPATALVLVGGLALVGGLLSFVINTFIVGFPALQEQLTASLSSIQTLLTQPPFNLASNWFQDLPDQLAKAISSNTGAFTSGALTTAATVTEVLAGMLLVLFSLIFFLYDGPRVWLFLMRAVPQRRRDRVNVAGKRAFASLVGYVRATVLVAIVDAVGIGLGLAIVGVPLVVPLAALVFLGAFIPTVGAVLTGAIAVLIALVANGPVAALVILIVVIAVQQLEGHVLQPLLLGRAVRLHALAVVLSVAAGVVIAGIVGALVAVPLLAVLNTAIRSLTAATEEQPDQVNSVNPRHSRQTIDRLTDNEPGWFARQWRRLTGQRLNLEE
ncbi:AI-2E family transporter [Pseudonocardia sp. GCM10023141]|uniref:AI-2E family transporter n=1 Tax=Pseudonocardia sp. GCM10023141 TaxID=3252653 RepID=UPI00360A7F6A